MGVRAILMGSLLRMKNRQKKNHQLEPKAPFLQRNGAQGRHWAPGGVKGQRAGIDQGATPQEVLGNVRIWCIRMMHTFKHVKSRLMWTRAQTI